MNVRMKFEALWTALTGHPFSVARIEQEVIRANQESEARLAAGSREWMLPRKKSLDIWRPVRYARARVYSLAVRIHAFVYFGVGAPVSLLAPLCEEPCEVIGGCEDCTCTGIPPETLIPAPFTGTPYDAESEED